MPTGRPVAQVGGLGPRVGDHLALFCIHRVNQVYGTLVVTSWTHYTQHLIDCHIIVIIRSWRYVSGSGQMKPYNLQTVEGNFRNRMRTFEVFCRKILSQLTPKQVIITVFTLTQVKSAVFNANLKITCFVRFFSRFYCDYCNMLLYSIYIVVSIGYTKQL